MSQKNGKSGKPKEADCKKCGLRIYLGDSGNWLHYNTALGGNHKAEPK